MMRKQRTLILRLQETHLDNKEAEKIGKMCPKIELISNGNSKSKEGVAFVINKELANNMTWNHKTLIEGRALRLTIKVGKERGLDIILIYAPNNDNDKIKFFTELEEKMKQEKNIENTIIMGDLNA
jgi:exonuclease III